MTTYPCNGVAHHPFSAVASLGHPDGFVFGREDPGGRSRNDPWTLDAPAAVRAIEEFI